MTCAYCRDVRFTVITQAWREQRSLVSMLVDCGQDGVCKLSPGCNRHWEERNRELLARALNAEQERDRLTTLFDDAGEGQYNVLNLVESYQRNSIEADERLRTVRQLLETNGCDCPCDHHPDERGPDCEVCLACRIGKVVGK